MFSHIPVPFTIHVYSFRLHGNAFSHTLMVSLLHPKFIWQWGTLKIIFFYQKNQPMSCYRSLSCLASRVFQRTTHWHFPGYFHRQSQGHLWYKHHSTVSLVTDYLQAQQGEMHCILGQVLWIDVLLTHLHSTFTPSNCRFAFCVYSIYFTGIKWVSFLFFFCEWRFTSWGLELLHAISICDSVLTHDAPTGCKVHFSSFLKTPKIKTYIVNFRSCSRPYKWLPLK